jgi:hypothetical protein
MFKHTGASRHSHGFGMFFFSPPHRLLCFPRLTADCIEHPRSSHSSYSENIPVPPSYTYDATSYRSFKVITFTVPPSYSPLSSSLFSFTTISLSCTSLFRHPFLLLPMHISPSPPPPHLRACVKVVPSYSALQQQGVTHTAEHKGGLGGVVG